MSEKSKDTRTRNWATILYPESATPNWELLLSEMHVPAYISPLHDKDINPTGEKKKAHYHIIFAFDGNKSRDQIEVICKAIGAVGLEKVSSLRGYARYLIHADNPEKAQYNADDVRTLGGLDYLSIISSPSDKYTAISEILEFCDNNNIRSYATLLRYCRSERTDWFRCLCDNGTYVIKEYLKSAYWEESTDSFQ